jgi:hypothetical protein
MEGLEMAKELSIRESEAFKIGYAVGLATALDSIMASRNAYVDLDKDGPVSLRTFKSSEMAILDFYQWLYGDQSGPSDFKTDFIDELPKAILSKATAKQIKLPPGVDRLYGLTGKVVFEGRNKVDD